MNSKNKYNHFLNEMKQLLEEYYVNNFQEEFIQEEIQTNINNYISRLDKVLNGENLQLNNTLYAGIKVNEDFLFKEKFVKMLLNTNLEENEFKNVLKYCCNNYYNSFIIMGLEQKDVHYLKSIIIDLPLQKDKQQAAESFNATLGAIEERLNSEDSPLEIDKTQLTEIIKEYLKLNEIYLKDNDITIEVRGEYSDSDDVLLSSLTIENLITIFGKENLYKFTKYLPFLPQGDANEELFENDSGAITKITINKKALLGKYPHLLNEGNIFNAMTEITEAINTSELSEIKSSEYNLSVNSPDNNMITLLFISNSNNELNKNELQKLLINTLNIYEENLLSSYEVNNKNTSITDRIENPSINLKEVIKNEWLEIKIPQKNISTAKKKI